MQLEVELLLHVYASHEWLHMHFIGIFIPIAHLWTVTTDISATSEYACMCKDLLCWQWFLFVCFCFLFFVLQKIVEGLLHLLLVEECEVRLFQLSQMPFIVFHFFNVS